jgi:hypothetical protein
MAIDTLAISRRLREAGYTEKQADVFAEIIRDSVNVDLSKLATKADLKMLEQRMTIKLGSIAVVVAGLAVALGKLL